MKARGRRSMKGVSAIGSIVIVTLCFFSTGLAENHVGLILDGFQGCQVESKGTVHECKQIKRLFAGDKVMKRPGIDVVRIKWAPYARGKRLDSTTLVVLFEPPQEAVAVSRSVLSIWAKRTDVASMVARASLRGRTGVPRPAGAYCLGTIEENMFSSAAMDFDPNECSNIANLDKKIICYKTISLDTKEGVATCERIWPNWKSDIELCKESLGTAENSPVDPSATQQE